MPGSWWGGMPSGVPSPPAGELAAPTVRSSTIAAELQSTVPHQDPTAAQPLLVVEGLRKAFGGLQALDGVDLQVGRREIVGLIGPNGSGKTTFFNVLTGYYRPDAGRIRLGTVELAGCRRSEPAATASRARFSSCGPSPR